MPDECHTPEGFIARLKSGDFSVQTDDNWKIALGGSNIFDEFIDEIGPPNANRLSVGLQYPRRTVANYEGGSWYARASYRF